MVTDEMYEQVINWYSDRFPSLQGNHPSEESKKSLEDLSRNILLPINNQFGFLKITYGFTSPALVRLIRKDSAKGTSPNLDQHASCEQNNRGNEICSRVGAACDFIVPNKQMEMYEVARWIIKNLPFDRMYLYGKDRPIHISYGPENKRFVQMMHESSHGKRYPGKSAIGEQGLFLLQEGSNS